MENGMATGELREFEAKAPVLRLAGEHRIMAGIATGKDPVPPPTKQEMLADLPAMERGLEHCARYGFTSLVNMDGNRYTLEVLDHLRREGRLTARVRVPYHFRNNHQISDLATASAMSTDYNDDWLTSGFVKMFMDGVVDSGTAVMINDYPDQPGWRGEPLHEAERFAEICVEADKRGLQIAVHAIGDGAVRRVLDGYEAARDANGARDARHRIEHIELIDRADIPRFAEMGVVASVQPSHPPGSMDFPLFPTLDKIGRDRWRDAYLTRTLRDAGANIVFASDWPVADVNPLRSIQAAVIRAPYEGAQDETLSLRDAIAAYTIGGAYAEHTEDRKGMLRPGYLADVVILSGDIEAVPADQISSLHVEKTICGGRIVWDAAANNG
ncbi:MAG: amidohydrolase family protein, partial [Paracoccaceae bacterium]|jgi:predicted amidohydrolase YtcJ|nr:amidohydrolase family protein [Paracoccaceae bacterium]